MRAALLQQRLVGLFALALWDRDLLVWGLPLFPVALFLVWALLIGALAWLMERSPD